MCARLMAKQKVLFYPTPLEIMELIASNIVTETGFRVRIRERLAVFSIPVRGGWSSGGDAGPIIWDWSVMAVSCTRKRFCSSQRPFGSLSEWGQRVSGYRGAVYGFI